jgi:HSP20 family protein
VAQFSFIPTSESGELADDIRELFQDLASSLRHELRAYSGECHPSLDVLETDTTIQVVVDVAGVPQEALRVLFRAGVLLVAGEKAPAPSTGDQTFHLVEREFGRFARAVRLTGAFDLQNSRATLEAGELTIVLPKMADRRGQGHRIPVTASSNARPPAPRPTAPEGA